MSSTLLPSSTLSLLLFLPLMKLFSLSIPEICCQNSIIGSFGGTLPMPTLSGA